MELMRSTIGIYFYYYIGNRQTEYHIQNGTLLNGNDAFKIGLVDELAKNKEENFEKCVTKMKELLKIHQTSRIEAKKIIREKFSKKFEKLKKKDLEDRINLVFKNPSNIYN
jgi:enoyl-CoA hydratase/carnithine racemase